jgi:hypothetical protein
VKQMKALKAVAIVILLALFAPTSIRAEDYISDVVQALKHGHVYVAPGTPGTNSDTAAKLEAELNKNDNIVLVMLPADAEEQLDGSPDTIARGLSDKLGNKFIIGLSVGREALGFAPMLPAGVASDLMRRANAVTNDPVNALSVFVQNVHKWQVANPQPTPTPVPKPTPTPVPKPKAVEKQHQSGIPLLGILIIAGIITSIIAGVVFAIGRNKPVDTGVATQVQVNKLLARIAILREEVRNRELQETLYKLPQYTERYFQKSSRDKERDYLFFRDRLTEVHQVLEQYLDIQKNDWAYYSPEEEMEKGRQSVKSFADFVLDSIRRGTAADLLEYKVNTNILNAQRSRRAS